MNNEEFELELSKRNFDFVLLNISHYPDPDPYYIWHTTQSVLPGLNLSAVNDLVLDKLIEQGRTNADMYERLTIYHKFNDRFDEIVPAVVLAHPIYSYITRKTVMGPETSIIYNLSERFKNIHEWTLIN